ncbi:sulfatase [Vallitalea okinawensis]|uniref:sulfatase n=1 Tax=Vallitalea okinawensis TaxID=2078660 RepID=UPI000CFAEC6A|nr:sulfatase [Vallitalea okinawensis]
MKPNILFILIDDMGWRDLGCYGSEFYESPNIDQLAKDGLLFDNAYAACPVCSPTRASILTGKYPASLELTNWIGGKTRGKLIDAPYIDHLPLEENNIAKSLKESGYATWHIGKWHLGKEPFYPQHQGFDVNIGGCHWGHPWKGYFSPYSIENLDDGESGEYLTDRLTSEAINLIEKHEENEQPFFLNLWYYTVHTPIQGKQEYITYFEEKAEKMGLDQVEPYEIGDTFPCEHKKDKKITRRIIQSDPAYASMIKSLDENIGRLINTLKEKELYDNTLIIFTSDNGGLATAEGSPTCNAPLSEGKGWMYEGGVREPLIMRYPALIKEGITSQYITSTDFYPTIMELIGEPQPVTIDGKSILPVLKGDDFKRGPIFWHYPHYGNQGGTPAASIRDGNYKLIYFFEEECYKLYDLEKDIEEKFDLSGTQPEVAKKLHDLLFKWLEDAKGKIPEKNQEYIPW